MIDSRCFTRWPLEADSNVSAYLFRPLYQLGDVPNLASSDAEVHGHAERE